MNDSNRLFKSWLAKRVSFEDIQAHVNKIGSERLREKFCCSVMLSNPATNTGTSKHLKKHGPAKWEQWAMRFCETVK